MNAQIEEETKVVGVEVGRKIPWAVQVYVLSWPVIHRNTIVFSWYNDYKFMIFSWHIQRYEHRENLMKDGYFDWNNFMGFS